MSQLDVEGGSAARTATTPTDGWRRPELFIARIRLTRRSEFGSRGGSAMSRRELCSYLMASLPSDHADVFDARVGTSQQLDANRLWRCHPTLLSPPRSIRCPSGACTEVAQAKDASHLPHQGHRIFEPQIVLDMAPAQLPKSTQIFVKVVPTASAALKGDFPNKIPRQSLAIRSSREVSEGVKRRRLWQSTCWHF